MKKIRFCLSQINPIVGDISGNTKKIIENIKIAEKKNVDIIIFPELSITGYPPEDLLLKPGFIKDSLNALKKIVKETKDIIAIIGTVNKKNKNLYNSAVVIYNKKIYGVYNKINLPNYSVFDEKRYFTSGKEYFVFEIDTIRFGVSICEDIWGENKVLKKLTNKIDFLININASPYYKQKWKERISLLKKRVKELKTEIIYVNLVGGQDELVFDGHSLVMDKNTKLIIEGFQFKEQNIIFDRMVKEKKKSNLKNIKKIDYKLKEKIDTLKIPKYKRFSFSEEVYNALILGTHDYIKKNGFEKVFIALSGGIDSALVSVIAVDALGKENVNLIFMPSEYTSKISFEDARKLSQNLGIKLIEIPITKIFKTYLEILSPFFKNLKPDITEENLQARIRGNIIMAFANKFKGITLTTGNKSEMSTGYATLYGDMAGGFAVIKDLPKTLVYRLAEFRNKRSGFDLIPANILKKPPSAELKHNQKDTDTLPEYEILDKIINDYIENDKVFSELKNKYDINILKKVIKMIDANEYKRRQAPIGIKITKKSFGKDRRMPITNKYMEVN